jgi:Uma2 family endonuclease
MSVTSLPTARRYTAEDLEDLSAQGHRYELIRGELHPMPPPAGEEHGSTTYDLGFEVGLFVRANDLGRCYTAETGFILARNPDTVLAPDFAFVSKEHLAGPPQPGFAPLVPDLVLETRSPNDRGQEVADKVRQWLDAGVRVVWELNLKARVLTVHRADAEPRPLGPDDTLTGDDVLPGFALSLRKLFR